MDTKLKNSNKALTVGIIISMLAAAVFTALFPIFKQRAADLSKSYYENDFGVKSLEGEFLKYGPELHSIWEDDEEITKCEILPDETIVAGTNFGTMKFWKKGDEKSFMSE